jgi:hypothetical protein
MGTNGSEAVISAQALAEDPKGRHKPTANCDEAGASSHLHLGQGDVEGRRRLAFSGTRSTQPPFADWRVLVSRRDGNVWMSAPGVGLFVSGCVAVSTLDTFTCLHR